MDNLDRLARCLNCDELTDTLNDECPECGIAALAWADEVVEQITFAEAYKLTAARKLSVTA